MKDYSMLFCCSWLLRRHQHYDELDDQEPYSYRGGTAATETSALLKNGYVSFIPRNTSLVDAYIASYRSWEDDVNLWTDPYDVTHSRSSQDHQLDTLVGDWRKADSEEEKKEIYRRIQAIRLGRKRVQDRWKKILADLGFATEAESLVSVSAASGVALVEPPSDQATDHHRVLVNESELFGDAEVQEIRYTIVLDRLIDLDVARDFVTRAKELYPKEPEGI